MLFKVQNAEEQIIFQNVSTNSSINIFELTNNTNLTGIPTAPTAATGTNTTQIATTQFVQQELQQFDTEIFEPVSTLPTTNINTNKIYIVPNSLSEPSSNLYDEYIYKNNTWEYIGVSQVDLDIAKIGGKIIDATTYNYLAGLLDGLQNKFVAVNNAKSYVIPVDTNTFKAVYIKSNSTLSSYIAFSTIIPTSTSNVNPIIGPKVYNVQPGGNIHIFMIPDNAKSIIIDGNNASGGSYLPVEFKLLTELGYNNYYSKQFVEDYDLTGKRISFLGDSITAYRNYIPSGYATGYPMFDVITVNQMWWKRVIDKFNMELGVCEAYSGSGVSGADDGVHAVSLSRLQNLGSNGTPDYIILQIGTNDCSADFGDFHFWYNKLGKTYDKTKFRDAYSFIVEKLLELYPNAKIICMTPIYRYPIAWENETGNNIYGYSMSDMVESIKYIASKYHVPCIDLSECGINYNNRNTYLGDVEYNHNQSTPGYAVHPNNEGMKLMANYIIKKLRSM